MSWCTHFLLACGCCYWKVQVYFLPGSYVRKRFFKKRRYFQGFLPTEIALHHQTFKVPKLHLEELTPSTGLKEDITANLSIKITADTTCPQAQSNIPVHGWSVPRWWLCPQERSTSLDLPALSSGSRAHRTDSSPLTWKGSSTHSESEISN